MEIEYAVDVEVEGDRVVLACGGGEAVILDSVDDGDAIDVEWR